MKVIDLLNKIANGEEVPEKFRFAGQTFEKQGSYIEDADGDSIFDSMCTDFSNINEEVEVIEEDKKIEKITMRAGLVGSIENKLENLDINVMAVEDKINEIIDKINGGANGE